MSSKSGFLYCVTYLVSKEKNEWEGVSVYIVTI